MVLYVPELDIGKILPVVRPLPGPFTKEGKVLFVCGKIIPVPVQGHGSLNLCPGDLAIMFAVIPVPSAAKDELVRFLLVLQGKNGSVKIIIQPESPYQVGAFYGINAVNMIWQSVICKYPSGLIFFVIPFSLSIENGQAGFPVVV